MVTHRDEPDDVPEAASDRIAAVPVAGGEFVLGRCGVMVRHWGMAEPQLSGPYPPTVSADSV